MVTSHSPAPGRLIFRDRFPVVGSGDIIPGHASPASLSREARGESFARVSILRRASSRRSPSRRRRWPRRRRSTSSGSRTFFSSSSPFFFFFFSLSLFLFFFWGGAFLFGWLVFFFLPFFLGGGDEHAPPSPSRLFRVSFASETRAGCEFGWVKLKPPNFADRSF